MTKGKIFYRDRPKYVEWKLRNFTSLMRTPGCIESPTFPFDGAEWRITFYTFGYYNNSPDTSVYLTRGKARNRKSCICCRIGIKRNDGTVYVARRIVQHSFTDNENITGFTYFVPVSKLRTDTPEIARRDEVTFFCWMSSLDVGYTEMEIQTSESEGINKLRKNLKDMLTSGEDSDVLIKVGDREFRAHRAILRTRSTVFASMFGHDMKERGCGIVDITDCDPQTFEQFLLYVYTGKVDCLSPEDVCHLYQVADKYDVQDLKTICVEYMEETFSTDTFCDVISLALRHEESELLENATQFFLKNAEKIVITAKWFSFSKDYPLEANKLRKKTFNFLVRDKK